MDTHIVTISDTHNRHKEIDVPNGDILIHAGDFSNRGTQSEIDDFLSWFSNLPHTWKILIAGNHDKGTDRDQQGQSYRGLPEHFEKSCELLNITLLNDSDCEIPSNNGEMIKIWGSPVQPRFGFDWAWNRDRGAEIAYHWDKIPNDADIVVTHGPPHGYGDRVHRGCRAGCQDLAETLLKIKPKLHVSGHIHEDRGVFLDIINGVTYNNASSLTLRYEPYLDKSFRFSWAKIKTCESEGRDYEE